MIGDVCALVGSSAWSANRADPGPCDTMIDVTEYLKTPDLPIDYLMDKIAMAISQPLAGSRSLAGSSPFLRRSPLQIVP